MATKPRLGLPGLQQLQDEGLVRVEEDESKRGIAHLTPAGEQYVEEFNAELSHVWESSKAMISIRFATRCME